MARVALVTGGTRGIGASISRALKAAGYKVAASYAGNDAAAEKFKAETGVPVYKWDVSSFEACAEGVKKVEADLGPVDVLVNNAGITRDGAFHKMTLEQWNAVINTNLGSLFNMTRQVIEGMRARKFGRVVNISSINGQKGQFGQCNYSAAKAGEELRISSRMPPTTSAMTPSMLCLTGLATMNTRFMPASYPQAGIKRICLKVPSRTDAADSNERQGRRGKRPGSRRHKTGTA